MRKTLLLFFLFFTFPLLADIDWDEEVVAYIYSPPPPAPLAPLAEEFPLSVSEKNRLAFMEGPAALQKAREEIKEALRAHTFPWLSLLFFILVLLSAFLCLPKIYDWWKKKKIPTAKQRIDAEIKKLQLAKDQSNPKQFYEVLTRALQNGLPPAAESMTTSELLSAFFLSIEKGKIAKELLEKSERIRFSKEARASQEEMEEDYRKIISLIGNGA